MPEGFEKRRTKRPHLFDYLLDESEPASGIKEVPSGRVCRPQKYPTPMVHYPNWQRETAQTRSSFGSNPK